MKNCYNYGQDTGYKNHQLDFHQSLVSSINSIEFNVIVKAWQQSRSAWYINCRIRFITYNLNCLVWTNKNVWLYLFIEVFCQSFKISIKFPFFRVTSVFHQDITVDVHYVLTLFDQFKYIHLFKVQAVDQNYIKDSIFIFGYVPFVIVNSWINGLSIPDLEFHETIHCLDII